MRYHRVQVLTKAETTMIGCQESDNVHPETPDISGDITHCFLPMCREGLHLNYCISVTQCVNKHFKCFNESTNPIDNRKT
jgi:hypothetical protein